ncbi:MAG: fructose 1,6-bisphosphatase [Candidatus Aenigmarchaeota archaeon]|nr:fructose 1,6-bisphosphatase [Candidatus Aenigmarchaeota archaeon]
MKITLSAIKADIGAVGGHTKPSMEVLNAVKKVVAEKKEILIDSYIGYTGDDIHILMSHVRGPNNPDVHKLAFDAFMEGTAVAKDQGLYGAGQDLLKTAFSGNVRGLGPGSAELEFEERPNEAVLLIPADKTEPGAFNLPLYYAFVEVSRSPGLILSDDMRKGAVFTIMDVSHTEADKVIELKTPEEYIEIASLLFNPHRYVIEKIRSRSNGQDIAAVSTSRLHNISGKYSGKDDPIALVRVQRPFLATEEVGAMFRYAHYVAGDTRGSHNLALMPVPLNTPSSVYYCNPIVSGMYFSMHNGKFTATGDAFADPVFDEVRRLAVTKSFMMRDNGFVMPSMLPMEEIEYTILAEKLKELDRRFTTR